ncbi:MAG: hypothetical protein UT13_C0001G0082 [Candidatus Pacebacteria bacterium GW2011_GWF2_38_9]|nr:MAG: hypothetical protein US20_C0027G0011 [Candidatus Pacebacteria bacterium GW2011_GWF1_36_5]KKQ88436.1 MAG: hypothetical protein UT13_C0001G0082 [Candidatus Pacebacteria bacterium GW2011_GWF2_38_9]HAZ73052.1 hypothetical protein [Candidatus Paceibacterota bacterium]
MTTETFLSMKLKSIKTYINSIPQKKEKIILFLIILSGIIIKLYTIKTQPLWLDEKYSLFFTQRYNFKEMAINFNQDVHPGGYYLYLKFLLFFTRDLTFLRILSSLVFQVLAIIFLSFYKLKTRKDFFSAVLLATLISFHPLIIQQSWQLRMYSLLIFIGSTSIILFDLYLNNKNKKTLFLLILSTVLGIYVDYSFIVLAVTLISYLLYKNKKIIQYLSFLLIYFFEFLLISAYKNYQQFNNIDWIKKPTLLNLSSFYLENIGINIFKNKFLTILIFILITIFITSKIIKSKTLKKNKEIALLVSTPFIITLSYSLLSPILSSIYKIGTIFPNVSVLIPRAHILYIIFFVFYVKKIFIKKNNIFLIILLMFIIWIPQNLSNLKSIYSKQRLEKIEYLTKERNELSLYFPESILLDTLSINTMENDSTYIKSNENKNSEVTNRIYLNNLSSLESLLKSKKLYLEKEYQDNLKNKEEVRKILNENCFLEHELQTIEKWNCQ